MAVGNLDFFNQVAPLRPSDGVHINQNDDYPAGGVDALTVSLGSTATDDILVLRKDTTEEFVVGHDGALTALPSITIPGATGVAGIVLQKTGTGQTTFARLRLPILETAPASAGLTKGDVWLAKATTDVYRFALCISTAAGTPRYGHRFTRGTIGTASH